MKPRIDWLSTIVPLITVIALCVLFMASPEQSSSVLSSIRFFLGEQSGRVSSQPLYCILPLRYYPVGRPG